MFGSIPAPYVSAPIRAIVTDPLPPPGPLPLTARRLHDALYCCAPCGHAVLVQHLQRLNVDTSKPALERAIQELSATVTVSTVQSVVGGHGVTLWTIPGQERVA